MSANWDSYLCTIDGEPASILVDLSLLNAPPLARHPLLGHARFTVDSPDARGFPEAEEYERLTAKEKHLADALSRDDFCVYAGRSMSAGRFDCFFYLRADSGRQWLERVRELDDAAEASVSEDRDWECYRVFLYPGPRDILSINNRRACEALAGQGDDPERSRQIEHLADFTSESGALHFTNALRDMDFCLSAPEAPEDGDPAGPFVFRVRFRRPDIPADLDELTFALACLAEDHAGIYRGWAAPVVA